MGRRVLWRLRLVQGRGRLDPLCHGGGHIGICKRQQRGTLSSCHEHAEVLFAGTVWSDVIKPRCAGCHLENGFAQQVGAKFFVPDQRQAGYMAENLVNFRQFAAIDSNGMPYLLAKASAHVPHQGGQVLDPNGPEYAEVQAFLQRTDLASGCTPTVTSDALAAVPTQTSAQVVRRAALQLAGRMPTAQEVQMANTNNLAGAVDNYLSDPNFSLLIKRSYEDTFLVDAFNYANVIGFLCDAFYGTAFFVNNIGHQVVEAYGLAHNAPELVSYVISIKSLIQQLIASPWYQAGVASTGANPAVVAQTQMFDTTSRREPETLNQTLEAILVSPQRADTRRTDSPAAQHPALPAQ